MKSKIICLILGIAIGMLSIFTLALKNENFRTFTKINASDKEIILAQENEIKQLKEDKENLENELSSATALKNQYLNEKNQLQESVNVLNERINNLNNELSTANNKLTSTESELAAARLQLETISSTLSQKETELLQKQKELEESIANGELQAEEIEQKQLEISNLQADINSLQTEKSNLEKTIENLSLEKSNLEQQIIDLNNEVDSLRSENNINLETISNLENEINNLELEITNLTAELKTANSRIEELENLSTTGYYAVLQQDYYLTIKYTLSDGTYSQIATSKDFVDRYKMDGYSLKQLLSLPTYTELGLAIFDTYFVYDKDNTFIDSYYKFKGPDYYSDNITSAHKINFVNQNGETVSSSNIQNSAEVYYDIYITNCTYEHYEDMLMSCSITIVVEV